MICVYLLHVFCVYVLLKGLTADAADPDLVAFEDTSVSVCAVVDVIDLVSTS